MSELDKEIDNIKLRAIMKHGYSAMPQHYLFLKRYSLLNIYYEIVNRRVNDCSIANLDRAIKDEASMQVDKTCGYEHLKKFFEMNGIEKTKALFDNNNFYWRNFLSIIRKKNDNTKANRKNSSDT